MSSFDFEQVLISHLKDSPLLRGCLPLSLRSRWQELPHLGEAVWIKRDDELSFSMSGSKFRKLMSLSQAINQRRNTQVLSWGSQRSAFLLALMQEARASAWDLELFLLRSTPWQPRGTDQLFQLWLETDRTRWVERSQWPEIDGIVRQRAEQLRSEGRDVLLIPEGGCMLECLPGAMSLAWEIVQQERLLGCRLTEVCLEAGSGFTAQALICGLGFLQPELAVEVLLCAGDEQSFATGLEARLQECEQLWGRRPARLPSYRCHRPPTARSYGAVNQAVWKGVRDFARQTGCLLDPLYGAKLYLWYLSRHERPLGSLLVHGGGGLNLFGFPQIPWEA